MANSRIQCSFSPDGEYFSYCSPDGCLKIWETSSDRLKQEYTPSSHLSSSPTCLAWGPNSRDFTPERKKAKKSKSNETAATLAELNLLAMGTLTGDVLIYSVTKADLHMHLHSGHKAVVNDVCWQLDTDSIFSCSSDQHIIRWKLSSGKVYEKWKADKEPIYSICIIDVNSLLSASSNSIKWWDVENKTVIKKFNGHGKEIFRLLPISRVMENSTGLYFISAAVGDRVISAWSLKNDGDCNVVASFTLPDDPCSITVTNTSRKNQPINLSVITKSSNLYIFEHQLNGRCKTPLVPKIMLQIASSNLNDEKPKPVPILACRISAPDKTCQMAYGFLKPVFETIELQDCQTETYLIREVSTKFTPSLEKSISKVKEPSKDSVIKHLAPGYMTPSKPTEFNIKKRKHKVTKENEYPMEERLNALYLDKKPEEKETVTQADSVIHLLLQGLQSQDKILLETALQCSKEEIIRNSVKRLPLSSIPLLLKELHRRINKKEQRNHPCLRWMKILLKVHLPYLMTCPDIDESLGPVSQLLEARVQTYGKMLQVKNKLEVLLSQVSSCQKEITSNTQVEAIVTYVDDSSSDEAAASESEESIEAESEKQNSEAENMSVSDSDSSEI